MALGFIGDAASALGSVPGAILGGFQSGAGSAAYGGPTDVSGLTEDQKRARALADSLGFERDYARTTAPTIIAPDINTAPADAIRARQVGALDTLTGAADGTAPSVAATQYAAQQRQLAAQQQGIAGQARGTAGVAARRDAIRAIGEGDQQAGLNAALLRAQEMATARGQLGGALSDVRGTDLNAALNQAQMHMRANEQNAANSLIAQQAANTYRLGLGQQQLGAGQESGNLSAALINAQQADKLRKMQAGAAGLGAVAQGLSFLAA